MSRQFVVFAVISSILLLQLATVCNGRATSDKEDELAELAEELRELVKSRIEDHVNEEKLDDEKYSNEEYRAESRRHHLTSAQKDRIIELHNKLRQGEGASNMYKLVYNENLARLAQAWSDTCAWGHRAHGSFNPKDYGFETVGENIWAYNVGQTIPDKPIQDWFDEKAQYDYNNIHCNKEPCGHYTAVTWHSTKEVGCGHTNCATLANTGLTNVDYVVCNYGPSGNNAGERPFKKGSPCTECSAGKFLCTDGLCDNTCHAEEGGNRCACKAQCVHGTKTADCKCQCSGGFTGPKCDEQCANKSPMCGANPGWPEMFCHDKNLFNGMMYDTVNQNCPKMCGKCSSKKSDVEEAELLESLKERMAAEKRSEWR